MVSLKDFKSAQYREDGRKPAHGIPLGFRCARANEVKQALRKEREGQLRRERDHEEGGVSDHLEEHELLPGSDKAFRLKDGYLFDFGAFKSFYPQYEHKLFTITHKLLVSTSAAAVPDEDVAIRSECDVALELLHACDEEDEEEIQNIVTSYHILKKEHSSHSSSSARLALLYVGTPWLNGGTALHFSARAKKSYSLSRLLLLEKQTFSELGLIIRGGRRMEEDDKQVFVSEMVCQEDYEGNTAFCSAALASDIADQDILHQRQINPHVMVSVLLNRAAQNLKDQYVMESIPGYHIMALLNADGSIRNRYQQHMEHKNMMGLTPLELALGHGHSFTWIAFWASSKQLLKWSSNKNEEAWGEFVVKRGVYKAWLLLLSGYANQEHFRQELIDQQCTRLNFSQYMFEEMLNLEGIENYISQPILKDCLLRVFLKALEVGFFPFCQAFLTKYRDGKSVLRGLVMGSTNYARDDVYGNNVLHLYAQGGIDEKSQATPSIWQLLLENVFNIEEGGWPVALKKHADPLNLQGLTPFMLAVQKSHPTACHHLKPHSSDTHFREYIFVHNDIEDKFGENIMHWYAKSQPNIPCKSWIIPQNVDPSQLVNAKNAKKQTPLELAFLSGHTKACLWLLDHVSFEGINPSKSEIFDWYAKGSAKITREAGEKLLNKLGGHFNEDYPGTTSLFRDALAAGNLDACHLLLDNQVEVSFEDKGEDGNNLLHCWCSSGIVDKTLWEKLTLAGERREAQVAAHINQRNRKRYTPFMVALEGGKVDFCEWLLKERADIVLTNPDGDDPNVFHAFAAGRCSDKRIWQKLLEAHMQTASSSSRNPLALLDNAITQYENRVHKDNPFNMALRGGSEDCALLFLRHFRCRLQHQGVLKCAAEGFPKSFRVWAELIKARQYRRSKNEVLLEAPVSKQLDLLFTLNDTDRSIPRKDHTLQTDWQQNEVLKEALRKLAKDGSLEVFDMMLQTLEEDLGPDELLQLLNAKHYDVNSNDYGDSVVSYAARCQAKDSGAAHLQLLDMLKGVNFFLPPSRSIMEELTSKDLGLNINLEREGVLFSAISESNACASSWWLRNKSESPLEENKLKAALWLAAIREVDDSKGNNRAEQNLIAVFNVLLKSTKDRKSVLDSISDKHGRTLIHIIEKSPQLISYILEISQSLLKKEDKRGFTPLFGCGSLRKLHVLIHHIVDEYKRLDDVIRYKAAFKTTPTLLHMQIKDFEKMAKLLPWVDKIEFAVGQGGDTILHAACKNGALEMVRLIVNTNPDLLRSINSRGQTPFHVAAGSSHMLIVKELLGHIIKEGMYLQVLLHERDGDERTALHLAARSKDDKALEKVKFLLEKAESVRIDDSSNNKDCRSLLLWASAGYIIGRPIDDAQRQDVKDFLQDLMDSIRHSRGQFSLLNDAATMKSKEMVKELINRGADIGSLSQDNIAILNTLEQIKDTMESDQPTIKDSLGRLKLAKGIAALLLNPCLCTPITVGIFAPWGMGKSSMMQQIEISLIMTIIHRSPLGAHVLVANDFPNYVLEEKLSRKGKRIKEQVLQIARRRSRRESNMEISRASLVWKVFWQCASWIRQMWDRPQSKEAMNLVEIQKFFSEYYSDLDQLYKGLALMERQDLIVSSHLYHSLHKKFAFRIPSLLTVRYNAWAYHGETEASAGLAMTVMHEIEASLDTARWLRLCFKAANRLNRRFLITGLLIPTVVCVVVGGWIVWLVWKLISIKGNNEVLKSVQYGSIPVSVVVITWIVLQKLLDVVKPISEQLVNSLQFKKGHQEKLGYQRQVIEDIKMFKEELTCKDPCYILRVFAMVWNVLVTNRHYIEGTRIAKGVGHKKDLRIVVFIDDLDRCISYKYILELLSAINLVLSVCDINVVMGVDKSLIEKAVGKEYENKEAEVKFLEKIVQVPIDLYDPSELDTTNFLHAHLNGTSEQRKVMPSIKKGDNVSQQLHQSEDSSYHDGTRNRARGGSDKTSVSKNSCTTLDESKIARHCVRRFGQFMRNRARGGSRKTLESSMASPDACITIDSSFMSKGTTNPEAPITNNDSTFMSKEKRKLMSSKKEEEDNVSEQLFQSKDSSYHDGTRNGARGSSDKTPESTLDESEIARHCFPRFGECMRNRARGCSRKNLESSTISDAPIYNDSTSTSSQGATRSIEGEVVPNVLVVDFRILFQTYHRAEKNVFSNLIHKCGAEQRKPRNWKRFMNYHRLVWSILLQYQQETKEEVPGWREQLIVWVFLCYNWKEQMNVIFKEWGALCFALKNSVAKGSSTSFFETCTLRSIIAYKKAELERNKSETPSETPSKEQDIREWRSLLRSITEYKKVELEQNKLETAPSKEQDIREWDSLLRCVEDGHDVTLQAVDMFQNFRFHCDIGRLRFFF